MSDNPPPENRLGLAITATVIVGSAIGVGGWHVLSNRSDPALDGASFDLADTARITATAARTDSRAVTSELNVSSLNMLKRDPGLRLDSRQTSPREPAPRSFKDVARTSGAKVSAFTADFRRRHPIMRRYSQEWMSYPDLKKINDDYMRDRDPAKLIKGLSESPNFGLLVKKIAMDPSSGPLLTEFITGVVKEVPSDLMSATTSLLNDDRTAMRLIGSVASAFGLPPGMLSTLSGGVINEKAIRTTSRAPAKR